MNTVLLNPVVNIIPVSPRNTDLAGRVAVYTSLASYDRIKSNCSKIYKGYGVALSM